MKVSRAGLGRSPSFGTFYLFCLSLFLSLSFFFFLLNIWLHWVSVAACRILSFGTEDLVG